MGIEDALRILSEKYGAGCEVSFGELLAYLSGPTYEDDLISLDQVLNEDLLLLHELAEICILKKMGHRINRNTVMNAYPDTYQAHLEAMRIELSEAERMGQLSWIEGRCRDLGRYLGDQHLPRNLEPLVHQLIKQYCRGL